MNRSQVFETLTDVRLWDLVVIGGGATGLGTALDAASRGYRTALLEAHDFAKGTSSRSTKLIHGGVRYLRSGQLRMVRESLIERGRLQQNAPHIVHPMQFVIPSYRFAERWYYFAGMKAYDLLAGKLGFDRSRLLTRVQASRNLPTLTSERLRGGVLYSDGQFDDARLAIALAQTIVDQGCIAINYAKVTELGVTDGRVSSVKFRDQETNTEHVLGAKAVVNATGVFGADVMALDRSQNLAEAPHIVASQGTHLILGREFMPGDCAMLIPDTDDGRVLFAIPWNGRTLIGTTDEAVDVVSLEPKPRDGEIDYLLEHAGRYLEKKPTRSDVLAVFSGLRPLVGKDHAASETSSLSREHEIHTSPSGLITVIGGKWTTYRKMGQDVVDLAAETVGLDRRSSRTADMRLHGYCNAGPEVSAENAIDLNPSNSFSEYGSDSQELARLVDGDPTLGQQLHPRLPYRRVHVVWAAKHEMARTVEDVLSRRTRALLLDAQAAIECAPQVAEILQTHFDADDQWKKTQLNEFEALAQGYLVR